MESLPAGVKKLKDGRYSVRPWDKAKRRRGETRKFKTLEEAVKYKAQVEAGVVDPASKRWLVEDWAEEWTTNELYARPKASTNLHNAERVKGFVDDFRGRWLDEITRQEAREWAEENKSRVAAVRAMLNDARLEGILAVNVFSNLRLEQSRGRKDIDPMTEAEVRLLAQVAYERWEEWPCMGAMVLVAAYTGIRFGELLALQWDDLDWAAGTVTIKRQWSQREMAYSTPKNKKPRTVALGPLATEALRKLDKHMSPDGKLVFYSPTGKRLTAPLHDYYWRQLREKFLGKLGAERGKAIELTWHVLRHFTGSWLVDKGVPSRDVAYQLGHTDGGRLIEQLYGHRYPDSSLRRIQEAMIA